MLINHRAPDIAKAFLLSDNTKNEIIDICINYHDSLSVPVIMEKIHNLYGIRSMVFASYILGQLCSIKQNNLFNLNLLSCQREN